MNSFNMKNPHTNKAHGRLKDLKKEDNSDLVQNSYFKLFEVCALF